MSTDKRLRDHDSASIDVPQRLPGVDVAHGRRIEGHADVHWFVDWHIARVVGIGNTRCAARRIAELIGPIVVSSVEHSRGSDVADPRGVGGITR